MTPTLQFQTRALLAIVAMFAVGLAVGTNASLGARITFLISLGVFLGGVGCVAHATDASKMRAQSLALLFLGQALVLTSGCVLVGVLGSMLRTLIEPWSLTLG